MKIYRGRIILKRLQKIAKDIGLYRAKPFLDKTSLKATYFSYIHS